MSDKIKNCIRIFWGNRNKAKLNPALPPNRVAELMDRIADEWEKTSHV